MPNDIITDVGEKKLAMAAGSGTQVAITHIALGDGGGIKYNPDFTQTNLRGEFVRKQIESRHFLGSNSWRVKVEFKPDETPSQWVREIGFFDIAGDLIALWAGTQIEPRQTGAITYLVEHVLNFESVADGLIIVNAPNDETFELAVANATAIANIQLEQLRQADRIRAIGGQY